MELAADPATRAGTLDACDPLARCGIAGAAGGGDAQVLALRGGPCAAEGAACGWGDFRGGMPACREIVRGESNDSVDDNEAEMMEVNDEAAPIGGARVAGNGEDAVAPCQFDRLRRRVCVQKGVGCADAARSLVGAAVIELQDIVPIGPYKETAHGAGGVGVAPGVDEKLGIADSQIELQTIVMVVIGAARTGIKEAPHQVAIGRGAAKNHLPRPWEDLAGCWWGQ